METGWFKKFKSFVMFPISDPVQHFFGYYWPQLATLMLMNKKLVRNEKNN
jgi:hypothetical protein